MGGSIPGGDMQVWRHSRLDSILLGFSVAQFGATVGLASVWERASGAGRVGTLALLVLMTVYNIIVVTHLFTHMPWFRSPTMNRLVSMLNSVNIGQSVQVYRFKHVRNHHRHNNDAPGPDGSSMDLSSTFRHGPRADHQGVLRYALIGAASTFMEAAAALLATPRLWRVGEHEVTIMSLAATGPKRRASELRQVQLDRLAQFAGVCLFIAIDWRWVLLCYVPGLYVSFALVNVQNYYEHFRAAPGNRYADSVSYYGRLYNLVAFNDGYHQEHHLRPQAHWTQLRRVRRDLADELSQADRVISPVPAVLGFLDSGRRRSRRVAARAHEQEPPS